MPPWVYLITGLICFSLGRVPALIVTGISSLPPMLRLTTLALNETVLESHNLENFRAAG